MIHVRDRQHLKQPFQQARIAVRRRNRPRSQVGGRVFGRAQRGFLFEARHLFGDIRRGHGDQLLNLQLAAVGGLEPIAAGDQQLMAAAGLLNGEI